MLLVLLLASFQSLPPLPTSKPGPSGAGSWVGGLVYILGPILGSSVNSPVSLGVCPAAASTPQVFSVRGLRLYFPTLELWVAWSVSLPSCSSQFVCTRMWDHPLCQLLPCLTSSPPGCLSLSFLPVWMNVSSLTPWLLDFHTV